jgi:hypothetical protein
MNKILKVASISIFILLCVNCNASEGEDSLRINLLRFLIIKGDLPKSIDLNRALETNFLRVQDLYGSSDFKNKNGIYRFICSYDEESYFNIFIKSRNKIEVYDISSIGYLISNVIKFMSENKVDNQETIESIKEILLLYDHSRKIIHSLQLVEYNFGSYKYFIEKK